MLQQLLIDRFHLRFHRVTRELTGYSLVISKAGLKIKEADPNARTTVRSARGSLNGIGSTEAIASAASRALGVPVINNTGLKGKYDISLVWLADPLAAPSDSTRIPFDPSNAPSIFTAVEEQLGLQLIATKVNVESIVVDSAERPSNN
jgi:uncharacterized protein (TIGR03435 family)